MNFLTQNLDLRDKTCCLSYMLPSFSQHNSFLSLTRFQFLLVNYKILIQDSRMFQERLTVDMRIPDKAIVFCRCTASCVKLLGLQCQTKGSANVLENSNGKFIQLPLGHHFPKIIGVIDNRMFGRNLTRSLINNTF